MKITVLNLNPCIDWHYSVPAFNYAGLNRVKITRKDFSGKGINVCAALKNLGLDPLCVGINFVENIEQNRASDCANSCVRNRASDYANSCVRTPEWGCAGSLLKESLDAREIRHDFIGAAGAVRVNIKLYDESTGQVTELNQAGEVVSGETVEKITNKLFNPRPAKEDILVISGSLPPGVPPGFYSRLCGEWPGKVFLDAEGEALRLAVENNPPFAIKPNLFELETAFGVKLRREEVAGFCRSRLKLPISCVSLGAAGAVLVTPQADYFLPALDIQAKGVQGAGDAMMAGLVYGTAAGAPETEMLKIAMAAAAASVVREGTEMCTKKDFEEMLGRFKI